MKRALKVIAVASSFLIVGLAVLGLAYYFFFDYPYPSDSTMDAWEQNYKRDVTSEIDKFRGYWVDADIAAYIYGYEFTSATPQEHRNRVINALRGFKVIENSDRQLVLKRPVTYSDPNGYDEWLLIFEPGTRLVTVLYANLDSEMKEHDRLVALTESYHKKRTMNGLGHR